MRFAFAPSLSFAVLFGLTTTPPASAQTSSSSVASSSVASDRLDDVLVGLDHTGTPPLPTSSVAPSVFSSEPGEERRLPLYEGRRPPATEATDALIWVPRVLFSPVWLVTEFVLRRPLIFAVTGIEESQLIDRFVDALTFLDGDLTLFPRFLADFGLRPSVGLSLLWSDFVTERTTFALNGSFWGPRWLTFNADLSMRPLRGDSGMLSIIPEFVLRPDYPYYGFGHETFKGDEAFYQARHARVRVQLRAWLEGLSRAGFALGYGHSTFLDEADGPAVDLALATNSFVEFQAYQWLFARAFLELDSRDPDVEFSPGSGVRAELASSMGFDPTETSRRALRFSGELSAFWDISSIHHILSVALHAAMLERLGGGPLPVTELIQMGGAEQMRSFLPGRFVGDSAWSLAVSYRWPVWILLDAEVFAELGNAHPGRFEGFRFDRSYLGWGAGLRSNWSREVILSLIVGFGTDRLDQSDLRPALTRFTLNLSRGF